MTRLQATRRLLHLAILMAAVGFFSFAVQSWIAAAALLPLAGLILLATIEVLLPLPLSGRRNVELGDRLLAGDECDVDVTVAPAPVPFNLQLKDSLPEGMQAVPGTQDPFRPGPQAGEATARYRVKARRRGVWVFPHATVTRTSAMGLLERSADLPTSSPVTVLPAGARQLGVRVRPRPLPKAGITARSMRRGPGDEFFALRQYLPGDSIGDVNWKATARMNRIITNEFLPDEPPRYLIYVDTRAAGAETGEADVFERTLELTSILVEALVDARAQVGLVLLSFHSYFQVPSGGANQLKRLRQMILDARPGQEASLHELLMAGVPHLPATADAVLVTPNFYDRSLAQALTFLRARHRRVSLLAPGFPEPAGDLLESIAGRAAGTLLNAEQLAAMESLRHYCDHVGQWAPGEPIASTLGKLGMSGRRR